MLKKVLKIVGLILVILILLIGGMIGYLRYEMLYKKTEIGTSHSPDGEYILTTYQIGEAAFPFGPVDGRFTLKKAGETINSCSFTVFNDGGSLNYDDMTISWKDTCVKIRVCGREQDDMMYTLHYSGARNSEKAGPWFTDDEVIAMVRENYGENVTYMKKDATGYVFQAQVNTPEEGTFSFYVEQGKGVLEDNYLNSYFKYVGDCYFEKYHKLAEWLEGGLGADKEYVPHFRDSLGYEGELMDFCGSICDFVEYAISVETFQSQPQYFETMEMTVSGYRFTFQPSMSIDEYERVSFYNELYAKIDEVLHTTNESIAGNGTRKGRAAIYGSWSGSRW